MANIPLKTIKFPGLDDTYTVPQVDNTLSVTGAAADAKKTGDELSEINERIGEVNTRLDENPLTSIQSTPFEVSYPWQSGDQRYNNSARCFWSEIVPADATITEVYTYIANVGANPSITFEIWELNNNTLTLATSKTITDIASNNNIVCSFEHYSDKPRMICYRSANVNSRSYRTGQTGYSWKYTTDVSAETTTLALSDLSTFSSMKLIGGFKYTISNPVKRDFFTGILDGNIIVFGDSTVDGSSVTGHTGNTIGTDRTATAEPNVYTSIVENMINTFTGGSKRVYNAGFGGKTLNYIADNYANIMNAFSDVKSAILVIDANSASGTRAEYEEGIRTGLTRMFELLKADGISFAVMSPQPMFFYPADDGTLPAINSAGEYYIGVNIGKDLCIQYNVPFIDLGNKTNYMMDSPYLNSQYFLGDRIHFGDNGHRVEAYELYGELIHPILYFDGSETYIGLQSNKGELSEASGISASFIGGYQSIVLQATNTRTDVLHRIYVLSRIPFTIKGITISGWTAYYDVLVDGETYTSNTVAKGDAIPAGWHEITVKPTAAEHVVRYSGLVFEKA